MATPKEQSVVDLLLGAFPGSEVTEIDTSLPATIKWAEQSYTVGTLLSRQTQEMVDRINGTGELQERVVYVFDQVKPEVGKRGLIVPPGGTIDRALSDVKPGTKVAIQTSGLVDLDGGKRMREFSVAIDNS